jgi:quercetin dioxygenase-like cupin family protein
MSAVLHRPGEGKIYSARGSTMVFKAIGAQTEGAFSFMEREMPPGGRMPPPHIHSGAEGFYILDGTLEFRVGEQMLEGSAGCFVLVPAGVGHTFGNTSDDPARLLIIHAPAADGYFAELADLWSQPEPPSQDQERALQRRHGWKPV